MKRIKAFALLLGVVVLASCASQKRVIYLQDTQADEQVKIAQDYQIRIKPLDRLTVVVNSRDPELAAPFNNIDLSQLPDRNASFDLFVEQCVVTDQDRR